MSNKISEKSDMNAQDAPNLFDWKGIASRFFLYYGDKTQEEIAEIYAVRQNQVSAWKRGAEKIPQKHLEKMLTREGKNGVTPEWLLFGVQSKKAPDAELGAVIESDVMKAIRNSEDIRGFLDRVQRAALEGGLPADEYLALTYTLLDALQSALKIRRSSHQRSVSDRETGS